MVPELSRQGAKDETRVSHWRSCRPCYNAYRAACGLPEDEDE
jgi:hypothetical protein